MIVVVYHDQLCSGKTGSVPKIESGPNNYCLSNTANVLVIGSQVPSNPNITVDNTFLWLIVPQVFNGLAQLLVNMTVLEFLCAQARHSLQGLLIGLWYAMFSICL